ncbi:MAG: UDP-3-O-(3-hydroxymyristoyl)glucosamine N-acyltransferase [Thermodesulfobacteriota bacterium]|nr:UDP-3-O-(3-hydroxymyristoyl)glucosamine N-acyltransferase [Thermodesulfobacteriota bacterium]
MEILLSEIAILVEGRVEGDRNKKICGVAPLESATDDDLTFVDRAKLTKKISTTKAGAVIVPLDVETASNNIVRVKNPRVAFAKVMNLFYPISKPKTGINPGAHLGENLICGEKVSIAPFAVVGDNVTIGESAVLHSSVFIGDNVTIGNNTQIYPNVTILERCVIGNRVIIHAGSVIGSDGFGFAPDGEKYYKVPQTGIVQIDDDVEIGAGNTIDRATFGKTWICRGVKTDNLVHIAHNVTVGEDTVIIAQTGIAGSSTIGRHAAISGQVAIVGHITVGDHVQIAGKAGVTKSVASGEIVSGTPAIPHRLWLRVQNIIPKLPEIKNKIRTIEKRLKIIEEKQER